jgi:hypothetical protein
MWGRNYAYDFGRFIAKEVEKWDKVVEFSGVKIKAE